MLLSASNFSTLYRPSECQLRVYLRHSLEPEAEPSAFMEVLARLGNRHEAQHLASMGQHLDLSELERSERIQTTRQAIADGMPIIYQPYFYGTATIKALMWKSSDFPISSLGVGTGT